MATVFLVMATTSVYENKQPIPLRVIEDEAEAVAWLNKVIDYHLSPPQMPAEDDLDVWNTYSVSLEAWRQAHPAGIEASQYKHFRVYEVPFGL